MTPPRVVRNVLLDAFGTLVSPRRPVHLQYAEVASAHGVEVDADEVKAGFKRAYKQWSASHPLYGRMARPAIDPTQWWSEVIRTTMIEAGVRPLELFSVLPSLQQQLVQRFRGLEGYALHDDVTPLLESLRERGVRVGVVSNTDEGIISVLSEATICGGSPEAGRNFFSRDDVFTSWRVGCDKSAALFWQAMDRATPFKASETLVIGDEYLADYKLPAEQGYQTLLLRRSAEHANPNYTAEGDEASATTITSLDDVPQYL